MSSAKWMTATLLVMAALMGALGQVDRPKPPSPQITQSANRPISQSGTEDALRFNNLGAAYMGQQKFEQALKLFQRAAALDPQLRAAQVNQGIALMNLQRFDAARQSLLRSAERDANDAHVWYNLGLLYKNQGLAREALDAFQRAAALAPGDADSFYFIGTMRFQLQQSREAIADFQHALALNHFHASAEFGLARALRAVGNDAEARNHLARFQELTQSKLGAPISLAYGDQGPLSLAEQARAPEQSVAPPIPVHFLNVTAQAGLPSPSSVAALLPHPAPGFGACFFDFDNDGMPDLFVAGGGKGGGLGLYHNNGRGGFDDVTRVAGFDARQSAIACAAADYDNDGFVDLAVSFPDHVALYRNQKNGSFQDRTATAGISPRAGQVTGLAWVDYDHDGDVDLYASSPQGCTLWRNNGNGTFVNYGEQLGLTVSSSNAAAATDYNNDRAIDVVLTGAQTQIFTNPREGKWPASQPWASPMPAPTVDVAILDFNKDGWMDLAFTHDSPPGLTLWRNQNGRNFQRVTLPDLRWKRAWGVVALDYDNDGWLDLAVVGETADGRAEVRLLRNEGRNGFRDVTTNVGINKIPFGSPRAIVAADYDGDGGTDLFITQLAGQNLLLRNEGGNRNNFLRLALKGLNDNKSAVGTKVEVFAGLAWQKFEVAAGGYLGQSSGDLIVGLGKEPRADVVRLLWPTGVLQDEAELALGRRISVMEIDRRGSSCPILFAWDGRRYRFVSDAIGAGVIGHWVAPGERNVPDPTEYLKVEGTGPRLQNGMLSFRLMEPMEEVVYVDQVRLLAVDHPANTEVFPNEYFASNPPFPEYKVMVSHGARAPAGAWDGSGHDVLPLLLARDHRYVQGLDLLPFKGFTRPHTLELDLGVAYRGGPLRLLMYGYIEYFTATSMFASHQAGIDPVAPYVEALDGSGHWTRVVDDMGFPAGLPRTTVADLTGRLPVGTRRIRITTNLQIYWDQVRVDTTAPEAPVRTVEVPLGRAELGFHGFPRAVERGTPGDLTYIYEEASATGPYMRPVGAYTRWGNVRELLSRSDDRFAVFAAGDELRLDFDPSRLPALPTGWTRDYFFFVDGFEKDMDFYAADPLTVTPLPFHGMRSYPPAAPYPADGRHLTYQLEFNNRLVSDTPPPDYRFHYRQVSDR